MENLRLRIQGIVHHRLVALGSELAGLSSTPINSETRLVGAGAALDSIGLVTLIADLEGDIQREFGKVVVLADEKAMSRTLSPFRKVGTLVEYVEAKLRE